MRQLNSSSSISVNARISAALRLSSMVSLDRWGQHDHRYLAFGLELVIGIGRPKFERLFPKSGAFLALRCPGPRLHLLGPDLHLDIRVGEDIAVPSRMFGSTPLRGDYEIAAAVCSVKQRKHELFAGLPSNGGQQQRWRRDLAPPWHVYLVHVPVSSTAREIAVGVFDHPIRQVRSEFRFSHHALLRDCKEHRAARPIRQYGRQGRPRGPTAFLYVAAERPSMIIDSV